MNTFADGMPIGVSFIVKNITTAPEKTIKIFQVQLWPGKSIDLMKLPGIGENDIRESLLKGDLGQKIKNGLLEIVSSSVVITDAEPTFTGFLATAGLHENVVNNTTSSSTEGGGNIITWAPIGVRNSEGIEYADPLPSGWHRIWSDAVAAVNDLSTPTATLQIMGEPSYDDIEIPGGTWAFNKPTTLAGQSSSADSDTDFRGYQYLLYVHTASTNGNPCKLPGVVGLKDMYFRSLDNTYIQTNSDFVTVDPGVPNEFGEGVNISVDSLNGIEEGKLIYINGAGYYRVQFAGEGIFAWNEGTHSGNLSAGTTIPAGTYIYPDNAVFYTRNENALPFTLDNCDFHFGNYRFGSFHVDGVNGGEWGYQFINMINSASTRWYGFRVDSYAVFQTDGSGCWIGSSAFFGDGEVETYPMAGCQIRNDQPVISDWYAHQPIINYIPNNWADWTTDYWQAPQTIHNALDLLAPRIPRLMRTTITKYNFSNPVNGSPEVINVGNALSWGDYISHVIVRLDNQFVGGGLTSLTVDFGGTDPDALIVGFDAHNLATGIYDEPRGIKPNGLYQNQQLVATLTPDAGHSLLELRNDNTWVQITFDVYLYHV
jgi:hypothetical protein